MNLVKTVRAGYRAAISTMRGSTRSIDGVSQMCPGAKIFCMSVQRWTASVIGSTCVVTAITLGLLARPAPPISTAGSQVPAEENVPAKPEFTSNRKMLVASGVLARITNWLWPEVPGCRPHLAPEQTNQPTPRDRPDRCRRDCPISDANLHSKNFKNESNNHGPTNRQRRSSASWRARSALAGRTHGPAWRHYLPGYRPSLRPR